MFPVSVGLKLLSFFTGGGLTTVFNTVADGYKAKLAAGETTDKLAADLAARQLLLDAQDAQAQARLSETERWYGPRSVMGYGVAVYLVKCLVWDKCFHLGYTDPLDDKLWWIVTTVIIAYFGARTIRDVIAPFRK